MSESNARLTAIGVLLAAAGALANPRPLPFTYPYETLPKGGLELEQFVDLSPVLSIDDADGTRAWSARYQLTTEVEYGITDRLELGLYFVAATEPGEAPLVFDGIKQRLRYRLVEAGQWPIDVALYAEIAEKHDELELELKINLQRRIGPARLMVNLSGERAWDYHGGGEWVLNPSGGIAFEITPALSLGLEYWMHAVLGEAELQQYAGPTVSVQWRKLWVSVAPYLRLDALGAPQATNDKYGRVWVRFVLGLEL